jgi:hypothetical protein
MRTIRTVMFLVVLTNSLEVVAWAQDQPGSSASVERCAVHGFVTHLLSGVPVKKTTLQLTPVEGEVKTFRSSTMAALGFPTSSGESAAYSSVSGNDGSFCFQNVQQGRYILSGSKVGFLSTRYGAASPGESGISLVLGAHDITVSLALIPQAVVSGRVLDEDDDPVSGAYVNLLARIWVNGHPRSVAVRGSHTDDLGEFRVSGLSPGTYYVRVDPRTEDPSGSSSARGILRTFYPGVAAATEATPLVVAAGAEIGGIGIRMLYGQRHHVRGIVTGLMASDRGGVTLLPEGEEQLFLGVGAGSVKPDGTFDFQGITPGTYTLRYIQVSGEAAKGGRRTIEVADRDVNDIVLTTTMPGIVRGKVRIEGAPAEKVPAVDLEKLSVALTASDALVGPGAATRVQKDGTFVIRNIITPGRYLVRCDLPPGAYLKSAQYGQIDVTTAEIDMSDGISGEMEIIYRYGLSTLSGTVNQPAGVKADREKAPPTHVVLVPSPLDPAGRNVIFGSTDDDGNFSLTSVPPGRYRAYAFESVDYNALHQPPVVKALETLGSEVDLLEGTSKSISLDLISAERGRRTIATAANQ